ncbi:MAG TPA: riboflavin synthase [Desulfobacteraceae bacterium]|nr:riboflavin synthase [Desulfobacteraceae bacterium]
MFTGLIEGIGKVKIIQRLRGDMRITIEPEFEMVGLEVGESICVDGVCLTVTELIGATFGVDVSGETLSRTTLGKLRQGSEVNLERALRLADRLGGHLVSGHVDGVGKILKKEPQQRSWLVRIGVDEQISRYNLEKGSVSVDGISLTINRCEDFSFEVNIIPQTGMETTILKKKAGDQVNIETDLIGKYVERFVSRTKSINREKTASGLDMEMLIRHGFGE